MGSEETVICDVCGREIPLATAREIPAIGYMCPEDDPDCKVDWDAVREGIKKMFPPTLEKLIEQARAEGAKEIHYHFLDEHEGKELWHWDVYSEDPYKWFLIPIPWTFRIYWQGFEWMKRNHRKLPISTYVGHWVFAYDKGAKTEGYQMSLGDQSPGKGLKEAVENYRCSKYGCPPESDERDYCDECRIPKEGKGAGA